MAVIPKTKNLNSLNNNSQAATSLIYIEEESSFARVAPVIEPEQEFDDCSSAASGSRADTKVVQVTIEFMRMGEIDTLNEKFNAELLIQAKWRAAESEEHIVNEYDPKVHWNPMLYIENAFSEPKESVRYEMTRDQAAGGAERGLLTITEKRLVKGVFWERLELHNFPVDVQELSIAIASKLPPAEIKLVEDPKQKSFMNLEASNVFSDQQKCFVDVRNSASYDVETSSNINIINESASDSNFSLYKKVEIPKLVATCYCSRKAGYYFFNAYSLIFLITISSLTIFSVDCKLPQNRLQTTYTILLTSVSFKWVINRSLPTISYLTSLDKYAIGSIFYVCLLCVWHSIVGSFWSQELANYLDFWLLIGFSIFFILIHVALFIWFYVAYSEVRKLKKRERLFIERLNRRNEDLATLKINKKSRYRISTKI